MAVMLSTLEEESDMYEVFPAHVDTSSIPIVPDSPVKKNAKPLKSWSEISSLIQAGRKRDVSCASIIVHIVTGLSCLVYFLLIVFN